MASQPKRETAILDDLADSAHALRTQQPFPLLTRGQRIPPVDRLRHVLSRYGLLYLMLTPGIIYYVIFRYVPMVGLVMAFQDYKITAGVFGSPWVGFKHFEDIFSGPFFARILF